MKIAVLGTTLQAGALAILLAECGNQIYWVSNNSSDNSHFYEDKEINQRLVNAIEKKSISLIDFSQLVEDIDVYILSYKADEFEIALKDLLTVAKSAYSASSLMVNGSTFGLHGTKKLMNYMQEVLGDRLVNNHWIYIPDTVQEGNAINSFLSVKEIVIGISNSKTKKMVLELLRPFFARESQYLFMPILDAEFTKLSISGMLATRISYMNDLANISEKLGIDIINVKNGLAADSRIGSTYLSPGTGFGGENFSHDILTLIKEISSVGSSNHLLEQVWNINEFQKEIVFRKLWQQFDTNLSQKVIAIWGAAFKENSTSTYNSPIHSILRALWAQGAIVQIHDPKALSELRHIYGVRKDLIFCEHRYDAIKFADALCIVTAWKEYFSPDYTFLLRNMNTPLIIDGRNIYDPFHMKSIGFIYEGIGRS